MTNEYQTTEHETQIIMAAIDATGNLIDMDMEWLTITKTAETLSDFLEAAKNYNRSPIVTKSDSAMAFEDFQINKGEQRKECVIVDFGNYRLIAE